MKSLLHGGDYNPDQWLNRPEILADDIRLMQEAHTNAFSVGIFAWPALEPTEGQFQFEWLDRIMDNIAAFGGKVLLATPSAARPAWMAKKYPEVLRTNARREKMLFGTRHNHCFSSPIYREKTAIINRKLAERYQNHPALHMWHISNEISGECHCPLCRAAFRQWLADKYQTIDALNAAYWSAFWAHTYSCFEEIDPPSPLGEECFHGLSLDWQRFCTHQTIDFFRNEVAPLKVLTPNVPIFTNYMAYISKTHSAPFYGLDYAQFAKELDIITWDAYPPWHNDYETLADTAAKQAFINDYYRALKDQPFLIMECTPSLVNWHPVNRAKRPGVHLLASVACLAHGADGILYFQWRASRGASEKFHGAVVTHDNTAENRVFQEVRQLGQLMEAAREIKDSHTPANAAIIFDTPNLWALNHAQAFQRDKKYAETAMVHHRALWNRHVPVDVITPDKDLSRYGMVIAPMLYMMDAATLHAFRTYVENGGTLVTTYISGMVNKHDLVYPGAFAPELTDLFGIRISETDTRYPGDTIGLQHAGGTAEAFDYCALITPTAPDTEVLATYTGDFYAGTPAITRRKVGTGQAIFLGARTNVDFLEGFYAPYTPLALPVQAAPGVSIQVRQNAATPFYFVMNFTDTTKEFTLQSAMQDLATGAVLAAGPHVLPKYGVHILKPN